jgi:HAD superfamily hydrolase (TIGR01509 family)
MAAFQRVFAPHGVVLDQAAYKKSIHGASNELIGKVFLSHLPQERQRAILEEKEAVYRAGLGDGEPIAGAVALLDFASRRGLRRAVVTNAPHPNAEAVLAALGFEERLPSVVIGSELSRAKPDPLPYLRALELTGSVASRSVAFGDSESGIRAAASAGLAVVGLATSLEEAGLIQAGASFAVSDFTDTRIFALIERRIGERVGQESEKEPGLEADATR